MPLFINLLIILFFFLVNASLVIYVVGPLLLLQPAKRKKEWYARFTTLLEPKDAGIPQEDITLRTPDGIDLACWLISRGPKAEGTILYLHGVGDCMIGGIALSALLYRKGFNVFLYDSRAHGKSGGSYCTYGYYEKNDVPTVINYLESRKDLHLGKIGVFGTSMGAAVGLQAAAIEPRIKAVIAEASFTDLRTIFVDYQRRILKLPWHFLRNVAMNRSQKIARFKGRLVAPIEDIRRITVPVFLIHGMNDSSIKFVYSKELYAAANNPKQVMLIENADHNDVWDVAGKKYEDAILTFFDTYLR